MPVGVPNEFNDWLLELEEVDSQLGQKLLSSSVAAGILSRILEDLEKCREGLMLEPSRTLKKREMLRFERVEEAVYRLAEDHQISLALLARDSERFRKDGENSPS